MNPIQTLKKRHLTARALSRAWGNSRADRIRIYIQIYFLPRNANHPTAIRATYNKSPFSIHVFSFRELIPFYEVFAASEYSGDWNECTTILDVGANIGASSLFFLTQAPKACITAFEPDKTNLARLQLNLGGEKRVTIVPKAMASSSGQMSFNCSDDFNLGSSLVSARLGFRKEMVETISLDDFLAASGLDQIDLLKFDVEGAEFDIFSASKKLSSIRQFIGEYHEDLAQKSLESFMALFPKHTVTSRKIAPSRYICCGRLNIIANWDRLPAQQNQSYLNA
jgi:FkbM family methyltransferase